MLGIYAVEDTKSGEFRGIFLQRSNEAAVRLFTDAILHGEDSMMRRYPQDYQVCRLGEFSELSGVIVGCEHPIVLATALQVVRRADEPRPSVLDGARQYADENQIPLVEV